MGLFIILVYVKVGGRRVYNARAVGVRSISVTNVLAVETSERMVHRALMTGRPEALEATHPHPDATGAVAEFLTLDDLREAATTLEDTVRVVRRLMGGAHPLTTDMEQSLRNALRIREILDTVTG